MVGRNLALELVRVTEAAALASSLWMGKGDKNSADGAAVEAMRRAFDTVDICGTVVIGEGEMDEAPMLYIGEKVGLHAQDGEGLEVDIAVDLGLGKGRATVWTCDLTHGYIDINGSYRS